MHKSSADASGTAGLFRSDAAFFRDFNRRTGILRFEIEYFPTKK